MKRGEASARLIEAGALYQVKYSDSPGFIHCSFTFTFTFCVPTNSGSLADRIRTVKHDYYR